VVDVTKRYTRQFKDVLTRRTQVSEEWLEKKLDVINQMLLSACPPQLLDKIVIRREMEKMELEDTLTEKKEEGELKDEEKEGRLSGAKEWKDSRGESGKPKPASCAVPPTNKSSHFPIVRTAQSMF
jgi:peptide-N4-(N-acetyl-beta-glucosaminyl)asparagine amidase